MERTILPSRAFFLSWRDQTIPARRAALADAMEGYSHDETQRDLALRDMALLTVIGEALQPLEDLAYLARAWEEPLEGLANYVRATAYSRFLANNFWQEVGKWSDHRVKVFTGLAFADHEDAHALDVLAEHGGLVRTFDAAIEAALLTAVEATVARVRAQLSCLASAWHDFSPYFLAYKHGGLVVNRADTLFVDDEVEEWDEATPRHEPAVAVWARRVEDQVRAELRMTPDQIVDLVRKRAELVLALLERFVESRLFIFEALDLADDGTVLGLLPLQVPWTTWLSGDDLTRTEWSLIGRGPRIEWAGR